MTGHTPGPGPVDVAARVASCVLEVPAMYGDHHVVEVRRILLGISGVESVNASSAFHAVEIGYDAERTGEEDLRRVLEEAGYLADLSVPRESGQPAVGRDTDGETYFRHTEAYEATGSTVGFGQEVANIGRPLWPCPGMGPAPAMDE